MPDDSIVSPAEPSSDAAADVPLAKVDYANTYHTARPGLVTAIGVMSIVVASLTALTNIGIGFDSLVFYMMLRPGTISSTVHVAGNSPATPLAGPNAVIAGARPSTLTAAQAGSVIAKVQQVITPAQLTAAQSATISRELLKPGQTLIDPQMVWSPVQSALVDPGNGEVDVSFSDSASVSDGELVVAKDGSIRSITNASGTTANGTTATPAARAPHISGWSAAWVGVDAALSIVLAIYLLVIGILLLATDRPANRTRHLRYAWTKLLLSVFGAAGIGNMFVEFVTSAVPRAHGRAASVATMVGVVYFVFILAFSAAYPIALLIALNRRSVRAWFSASGPGR